MGIYQDFGAIPGHSVRIYDTATPIFVRMKQAVHRLGRVPLTAVAAIARLATDRVQRYTTASWRVNESARTLAVIVAIAGQERNRIYQRTDDGSNADQATLALQCEVAVKEGPPLPLGQGRFHSIHTTSGEPTLQLHRAAGLSLS